MAKAAKPTPKKIPGATKSSGDAYKDIGVKRTGRPSGYSEELTDRICELIAVGNALITLCELDGMPDESTVYRWLEKHPSFRQKYARARERQAERGLEEMRVIADTATDHAKARNQIDVRKWHLSKLLPHKYGDKLELSGSKENPLAIMLQSVQGGALEPATKVEISVRTGD